MSKQSKQDALAIVEAWWPSRELDDAKERLAVMIADQLDKAFLEGVECEQTMSRLEGMRTQKGTP